MRHQCRIEVASSSESCGGCGARGTEARNGRVSAVSGLGAMALSLSVLLLASGCGIDAREPSVVLDRPVLPGPLLPSSSDAGANARPGAGARMPDMPSDAACASRDCMVNLPLEPGAACRDDATCSTGFCAVSAAGGNVCCRSRCNDPCQLCSVEGYCSELAPECTCFPGAQSTCRGAYGSRGACAERQIDCTNGQWPSAAACAPIQAEVCDPGREDEDCDGQLNEGCACMPGQSSTCEVAFGALGVCGPRPLTCSQAGAWPSETCLPTAAESCGEAFEDEDCDGALNETPCPTFTFVAGSADHVCGITSAGTVACWGANGAGQLGDGTTIDRDVPTAVAGLSDVQSLALSDDISCAITRNEGVACWGGRLERVRGGEASTSAVPVAATLFPEARALTVGATGDVCALAPDGRVLCAGFPGAGDSVRAIEGLEGALAITGRGTGVCGLLPDGTVRCWDGNLPAVSQPVPELAGVVEIDGDAQSACARLVSGEVRCWGANNGGQLGDGTFTNRAVPGPVPNLPPAIRMAFNNFGGCVLAADAGVTCWGFPDAEPALGATRGVEMFALTFDRLFMRLGNGEVLGIATANLGEVPRNGQPGIYANGSDAWRVFGP